MRAAAVVILLLEAIISCSLLKIGSAAMVDGVLVETGQPTASITPAPANGVPTQAPSLATAEPTAQVSDGLEIHIPNFIRTLWTAYRILLR